VDGFTLEQRDVASDVSKLKRQVLRTAFQGELGPSDPDLRVASIKLPILTAGFGPAIELGTVAVVFTSGSLVLGSRTLVLGSIAFIRAEPRLFRTVKLGGLAWRWRSAQRRPSLKLEATARAARSLGLFCSKRYAVGQPR
jgi:hypothetical protein